MLAGNLPDRKRVPAGRRKRRRVARATHPKRGSPTFNRTLSGLLHWVGRWRGDYFDLYGIAQDVSPFPKRCRVGRDTSPAQRETFLERWDGAGGLKESGR